MSEKKIPLKTVVRAMLKGAGGNPDEADALITEAKRNQGKLRSCDRHDFEEVDERRQARCRRCGGTVTAVAAIWYGRGLEHGANS